jgi:Uma2 family endonuclease
MTATASLLQAPFPLPERPIHRLSVEQYHRMIETGVLTKNDRVELLEGILVSKMPHSPSHDGTISILLRGLRKRLPEKWIVRVQSAVTFEDSEPEPDLAVVRGPEERYRPSHPGPKDIGLLIEVADSTLQSDREIKGPLFAGSHVPVYWVVNLIEQQVEVYSQPVGGKSPRYRKREDFGIEFGVPIVLGSREIGGLAVKPLFY